MKELIEFIARELVEEPEAVSVRQKETRYSTILKLRVAQPDMGRVIGKGGRVANAMRSLLDAMPVDDPDRDVMLEID